jgi:NAD+ synthase
MNDTKYWIRDRLWLNAELAEKVLTGFIRDAVDTTRSQGVVVGLSGGVDSALAAALAAKALGASRVGAFKLPYRTSNSDSLSDAEAVAAAFGLETTTIDISHMVDLYFETLGEGEFDKVRLGNKTARERMSILFVHAKKLGCLVLGTSNKTEILLGYSTIFGDCPTRSSTRSPLRTCGLARPTKGSSASTTLALTRSCV